ncbi:T9SS type A sorting domain-containing protein [Bacteroidota bacterium]
MRKFYTLILIFAFYALAFSQNRPFYLMVNGPEYIPINNSFEISVFTRISEVNTHFVNFYLLVDDQVSITNAMLCSETESHRLSFRQSEFRGYLGKAYKIDLGLNESSSLFDSFFEVCVGFDARGISETEIAFGLEVEFKDGVKEYFSSYDQYNNIYPLPVVEVNFYEPQSLAGKSLELIDNSELSIRLKDNSQMNNLMIEFWAKLDAVSSKFFCITNETLRDTIVCLSSNKFKIVSPDYTEDLEVFDRVFVSKNSWNHYIVFLNNDDGFIEVYSNSRMLFKMPFDSYLNFNDLQFSFNNRSSGSRMELELLKIWDFNNSIDMALLNKHYLNYEADDSRQLLSLTFDEQSIESLKYYSNSTIEFQNADLSISDAPIFSQAPELNVYIYSSFYSIEWNNNEILHAEEFILEKSLTGYDFVPIHKELSSSDPEKVYYYSDFKNVNDEIVVYRLKQINKDGSIIYSPQVKIGQGEQQFFNVGQNYPNPFNPTTNISVEMYETAEVEISVFNIVGKQLVRLHTGPLAQGIHSFMFDGSNLPSGIYFFEVKSPLSSVVQKMILAK